MDISQVLADREPLIDEALAEGGPDMSRKRYEAVRDKVLAVALTPEETMAAAEAVAANGRPSKRALFREWMRIQGQAQQGQRFEPAPEAPMIAT